MEICYSDRIFKTFYVLEQRKHRFVSTRIKFEHALSNRIAKAGLFQFV